MTSALVHSSLTNGSPNVISHWGAALLSNTISNGLAMLVDLIDANGQHGQGEGG